VSEWPLECRAKPTWSHKTKGDPGQGLTSTGADCGPYNFAPWTRSGFTHLPCSYIGVNLPGNWIIDHFGLFRKIKKYIFYILIFYIKKIKKQS
jgi:hypothetical protein